MPSIQSIPGVRGSTQVEFGHQTTLRLTCPTPAPVPAPTNDPATPPSTAQLPVLPPPIAALLSTNTVRLHNHQLFSTKQRKLYIMAGGPAASVRGRAGKFNKPSRGGGKKFSRDLQPVDADGNQISMWATDAAGDRSDEEEEDSEEDSEEDNDDQNASKAPLEAENREDRKALKKARKEAAMAKQKSRAVEVGDLPSSDDESDSEMPTNPNHSKAARKQAKTDDEVDAIAEGVDNMSVPGNRKEREAAEAAAAKERYLKLQAEGKTDQAKADMARLKLIREQRAADAARRQAEKEEREEQEKARKAEIEARDAKKREAAAGPKKSSKKK
ncbi:hypothetical protein E4U53_006519 [Claviceps sorghi]|nr:hypothetical protein E4U53_006519 [Claviceps sorghi]